MIWATVSCWSCFHWLYRASPSLAAENIISLISMLTIWWCPCVESSLVLLEEGVCYDPCILSAKLYKPLPWFILSSKAKFACYSRCFLTSYFCIPVPYNEKGVSLGVSCRTNFNFSLFSITGWFIDLDYCDIEWFALEMNRDDSVIFGIAPKNWILDSCWLWGLLHFF